MDSQFKSPYFARHLIHASSSRDNSSLETIMAQELRRGQLISTCSAESVVSANVLNLALSAIILLEFSGNKVWN